MTALTLSSSPASNSPHSPRLSAGNGRGRRREGMDGREGARDPAPTPAAEQREEEPSTSSGSGGSLKVVQVLQRQLREGEEEKKKKAAAGATAEASVATVSVGKSPREESEEAAAAAAEVTSSPPRSRSSSPVSGGGTGGATTSAFAAADPLQAKKKIDKGREPYKTTYKTYSPHDMQTAYRIYIESKHLGNTISIRRLAKVSGIPYATLRDHINGRKNKSTGLAKDLEILSQGAGSSAGAASVAEAASAVVGRTLQLSNPVQAVAAAAAASLPMTTPLAAIQQVAQRQQLDLGTAALLLRYSQQQQQQQQLDQRRHLAPGEPLPTQALQPSQQPPQHLPQAAPTLQALNMLGQLVGRSSVASQQQALLQKQQQESAEAARTMFTKFLRARNAELQDTNSLEWMHGLRYSQAILKAVAILFSQQKAGMEHMLEIGKKCVEWVGHENTLSDKAKAVAELILFNASVDFPKAVTEYMKTLQEAEALRTHFTEASEKILGGPGPMVDAFRAEILALLQKSNAKDEQKA